MRLNAAALWIFCCVPIAASAQSGRQERTFTLPAGVSVEGATISRAGDLVAAICSDHAVRVWTSRSGEVLRTLSGSGQAPRAVGFSNDGRLIAVAYQVVAYEKGAVRVFDVGSWKMQHEFGGPVSPYVSYSLAFSPDDRRLAFFDVNTQIWDLANPKNLTDISPPFGGSLSLAFSPDGRWVATADGDGFVRVYDASNGSLRGKAEISLLELMAVAFSPDGKSLFAGGVGKTISIISPETGRVLRTLPIQPGVVLSLAISANGKQLAIVYTSADDFFNAKLMLWDLDHETMLTDFKKPGLSIVGGAFVENHFVLAATSSNELTLWSLP